MILAFAYVRNPHWLLDTRNLSGSLRDPRWLLDMTRNLSASLTRKNLSGSLRDPRWLLETKRHLSASLTRSRVLVLFFPSLFVRVQQLRGVLSSFPSVPEPHAVAHTFTHERSVHNQRKLCFSRPGRKWARQYILVTWFMHLLFQGWIE